MESANRIVWIDQIRGFCMMLILWFHTEMYYAKADGTSYHFYVCNALTAFFFLSGYLFFTEKPFSVPHKLVSVCRGIIVPYFIYTAIMAFPKAFMNDLPLQDVLVNILLGRASWFIAALTLAELCFIGIRWLNEKFRWLYEKFRWLNEDCMVCAAFIVSLTAARLLTGTNLTINYNYWHCHSALIALAFICLGYLYHKHEAHFQRFNTTISASLLILLFIATKIYVWHRGVSLLICPVSISNYPVFIIDNCCFILVLIALFRRLPGVCCLSWTGKHSLVYYFFCGAVPMATAWMLEALHLSCDNRYWLMPLAFLLVYALTTLIVWLNHYLLKKVNISL